MAKYNWRRHRDKICINISDNSEYTITTEGIIDWTRISSCDTLTYDDITLIRPIQVTYTNSVFDADDIWE